MKTYKKTDLQRRFRLNASQLNDALIDAEIYERDRFGNLFTTTEGQKYKADSPWKQNGNGGYWLELFTDSIISILEEVLNNRK